MRILTLLLIGFCCLSAQADESGVIIKEGYTDGKWTMDYQAAKKFADEKKLPILQVFTGSDWCGWCQLMDKKVLHTKEFLEQSKGRYVLVTVDFPQDKSLVPEKFHEQNRALSKRFKTASLPSYVLISHEDEKLWQFGAEPKHTPASVIGLMDDVCRVQDVAVKKILPKLSEEKAQSYRIEAEKLNKLRKQTLAWLLTNPNGKDAKMKFNKYLSDFSAGNEKLKAIIAE